MSQTKAQLVGGVGFSTADRLTVHNGVVVTGVVTATSFSGDITGDVTGNATGLTGSPNIDVTNITASGNVTIGGTLTYEDVTNIDSIGIVTARSGVHFGLAGVGGSVSGTGNANFAGIVTATSFSGDVTGTASNASGATGDFSIADKIVHTGDTDTAIRFPATDTITFETSGSEALRIASDGSATFEGQVTATTSTDAGLIFKGQNGTATRFNVNGAGDGFFYGDLTVAGGASFTNNVTCNGNVDLQDNDKILLGTGDDLQIYHDALNSYIDDGSGTGALIFKSNTYSFRNAADSEQIAFFNENGSVNLYYNNSEKLATKGTGVDITGELQCGSLDVNGNGDISGTLTVGAISGNVFSTVTVTATSKTVINREYCTVTASGQTITLPASPSAGDEVVISVGNFTDTVIARNGSNIMGLAENITVDVAYVTMDLVYIDATRGWRIS